MNTRCQYCNGTGKRRVSTRLWYGEVLCHECTRDNFREILHATKTQERTGWNFQDVMVNWEDPSLYCAHCDEPLEPEYCEHEQTIAANTHEIIAQIEKNSA